MAGTDCGFFTHKSVPVIFEPPCTLMISVHFRVVEMIVWPSDCFVHLHCDGGPVRRETCRSFVNQKIK